MTKIRGKTGAELDGAQQDFHLLRGGFHEFEWVVYDEVHSLDGAEGAALQRLIRMVSYREWGPCPSLQSHNGLVVHVVLS